ncbi:MAG: hypothetical protein PUC29_02440 [Clostridia bacterium]|nr:hypothetical protein [Clostridia bacterium]
MASRSETAGSWCRERLRGCFGEYSVTIPPSATRADTSLYTREANYTVRMSADGENIKFPIEIATGATHPRNDTGDAKRPPCAAALPPSVRYSSVLNR